MAKELVLDVVARKNSKDLQALALEFDKLAASVDGSNKSSQQSVRFSKFLDDQIAQTTKQVQQLRQEFDKTGSADVFSQLRGSQRNLDSLVRIRKQLGDSDKGAAEATRNLNKELDGSDRLLRDLSDGWQDLGRNVRKTQIEYDNLTERIKVQTQTVRDLQRQARSDDSLALYARQASRDLERMREDALALKTELAAGPKDASKNFQSFEQFASSAILSFRKYVGEIENDFKKTGNIGILGGPDGLQNLKKDLKEAEDLAESIGVGIEKGGKEGIQFLGDAFGSLPPEVQVAIGVGVAGAIVASGAAIGAAFTGALLAGVGGIGIGAAIATQLKSNPAVASGFKDLGSELKQDLTSATIDFAPVLIQGAAEFGQTFSRITPVLKEGFDALVGPAERLISGIEGFVAQGAPGFSAALKASGIVLDEIAADLPALGRDFSIFFRAIGDGASGGADAIGQIIHAVGILAVATGGELDLLSKVFSALEIGADFASGNLTSAAQHMAGLSGATHQGADAANELNGQLGPLGASADDAANSIGKLNTQIDTFINKSLQSDKAAIAYQADIDALSQSIQQNGRNWDINTAAGRANQQALLDGITAAEQKRQADIDAGKDAVQAAQDYNQEVDALLAIAQKGGDAKSALDALKGKYEIDVQEYYTTHFINEGTPPSQFFHGLAGGGPVNAGQPYIVGENGPEIFMSDVGGQIIPNDVAKKLGSAPPGFKASSATGGGSSAMVTFAGNLDSAFATAFQYLLRTGQIQISS